jgi:diacylglycerol kinase (ATP)
VTLVIWNPEAGKKAGVPTNAASEDDLRRALREHGVEAELFRSTSSRAAEERVDAAIRDGNDSIIAAGGDGTAQLVAVRLLGAGGDRSAALGILPMGSAMNLARSLGIPRDLGEAAAVIAQGNVRTIDVGDLGGRPFFEQVSVGLSAEAFGHAQEVDHGRWLTAFRFLRVAMRYRRTRIRLTLDGHEHETRALAVAIANGPYTGMGLTLAPDAKLDDGKLDVVVFEGLSPWAMVRHMFATAFGRRTKSRFRTYRAAKVRVDAHRPLAVRCDADDGGNTPIEVSVRAKALRVLAPPAAAARSAG